MNAFVSTFLIMLPIILLAFWLWMFIDMTERQAIPPCFVTITHGNNRKLDWAMAFVILNVITAGFYYFSVYRSQA